LTEKENVEVRQ